MNDSKDLLSIGEVSRIFRISPKTLRHYDKIGLIKPAYVDSTSQYRYYSISQFPFIIWVKKMKLLGISLADICQCIDRNGILQVKKALTLVDAKVQQTTKQLIQLQKLQQLFIFWQELQDPDFQKSIPSGIIEIKSVPARTVVFTRLQSRYEYHAMNVRLIEVVNLILENSLFYNGPLMAVFHDEHRAFGGEEADIEVCMEVAGARASDYQFIREIPAGLYASVIHKGCYRSLITDTYPAFYNQIKKLNYQVLGPSIQIYNISIKLAESPSDFVTEVEVPVKLDP